MGQLGSNTNPVISLYTSKKVFSMHHHIDITDEAGNIVYQSKTKVISLRNFTEVFDASGVCIATIKQKLFSWHLCYCVSMDDGVEFELTREMFHLVKDVMNISGLGWQLRGDVFHLNFELRERGGELIASISQKMLSIHDKYRVDIYRPEDEKRVVALLIALQHFRSSDSDAGDIT